MRLQIMRLQRTGAVVAGLLGAVLLAPGGEARAAAATEAIRAQVDRAIQVLKDPALRGDAHVTQRRAAVRKIADEIFDFEEMAKRALGPHWKDRKPDERQKFVGLFSDLLERAYFSRIDSYQGEKVRFLGDTVDGDQATVRTVIVTPKGTEVPVNYRMLQENGRWRVYDVLIEGVSFVDNYRTQFNRVIRTESYDALVKKLEQRNTPEG